MYNNCFEAVLLDIYIFVLSNYRSSKRLNARILFVECNEKNSSKIQFINVLDYARVYVCSLGLPIYFTKKKKLQKQKQKQKQKKLLSLRSEKHCL